MCGLFIKVYGMEEHLIYPNELISPTKPNHFEVDYCGLTSMGGVVGSTTLVVNSTTIRPTQHWDLLTKEHHFWKVRSQSTTAWAFFAPSNTSCWEVNSSASSQPKQLKCLFCIPRGSNAKLWKGIIIYKTTNGNFCTSKTSWKHWMMWTRWIEQKKDGHEIEKWSSKKRSNLTPSTNCFFSTDTPYTKDNLHRKQFEKNLRLFIAKELIPLSFFKTPFFKRLFLKQNGRLNFPSRHSI